MTDGAKYQKNWRDKMKSKGLVSRTVWIKAADTPILKKFIEKLNGGNDEKTKQNTDS